MMSESTKGDPMWQPKEHVVWRSKNELLVVLDTVSGHYFTLNEVAVALWRGLFEEKLSLDAVLDRLRADFDQAPDAAVVEADCRASIDHWLAEGLIEARGA